MSLCTISYSAPISQLLYWYCIIYVLLLTCEFAASAGENVYKLPLRRSTTMHTLDEEVLLVNDNRSTTEPLLDNFTDTGSSLPNRSDNLLGTPGEGYYVEMGLGTPPQFFNVLVDTGSSNFAVAAAPHEFLNRYFNTSGSITFESTGRAVYVPYTQGEWRGHLGRDLVQSEALCNNKSIIINIACITTSQSFFINASHWQGILGLGYPAIAKPDSNVEPFFNSLVKQLDINNSFSLQLCGTIDTRSSIDVSMGGTLVLGGLDSSLYVGEMLYADIYKEIYYEVIVTDIAVNEQSLNLKCTEYNYDKTIVDSGTTNLRLPETVFNKLVALIIKETRPNLEPPPERFWHGETELCWLHETPWDVWPFISLTMVRSLNSTFDLVLSPQQYLRSVAMPERPTEDCYKFAITISTTGTVLGAIVMEGFYIEFDRAHSRVGFAKSTCPNRDDNTSSYITGPHYTTKDLYECAYHPPTHGRSTLTTIAYVMAGVCGACLIPLLLMFVPWQWRSCRERVKHGRPWTTETSLSTTEVHDIHGLLASEEFTEVTETTDTTDDR